MLIKFQDWLVARESSAQTRLRANAARGLAVFTGSLHGRSTASPFETEKLSPKKKRKKKKKNGKNKSKL
jgi:hypothetical protein